MWKGAKAGKGAEIEEEREAGGTPAIVVGGGLQGTPAKERAASTWRGREREIQREHRGIGSKNQGDWCVACQVQTGY